MRKAQRAALVADPSLRHPRKRLSERLAEVNSIGVLANRMTVRDGIVRYRRQSYPLAGATATVGPDTRSGLFGRKHTVTVTVTLATGEQLLWEATESGTAATAAHRNAARFVTTLNNTARRS